MVFFPFIFSLLSFFLSKLLTSFISSGLFVTVYFLHFCPIALVLRSCQDQIIRRYKSLSKFHSSIFSSFLLVFLFLLFKIPYYYQLLYISCNKVLSDLKFVHFFTDFPECNLALISPKFSVVCNARLISIFSLSQPLQERGQIFHQNSFLCLMVTIERNMGQPVHRQKYLQPHVVKVDSEMTKWNKQKHRERQIRWGEQLKEYEGIALLLDLASSNYMRA